MNPIYIEYGIHQGTDCYKIDLPWTEHLKETITLCRVEDGIELARTLSIGTIVQHMSEVTRKDLTSNTKEQ